MKVIAKISLAVIALAASTGTVQANERARIYSLGLVSAPAFTFMCRTMRYVDECVLADISSAIQTTATALLLKELEAAKPDALEYSAGSAPSPALYAAVDKLQVFASDHLDRELSFEDSVNEILKIR